MAKKFYVVWIGRQPGIYTDWAACKLQTEGFKGTIFKSFPSLIEAENAFKGPPPVGSMEGVLAVCEARGGTDTQSMSLQASPDVEIFSDGACRGNPGQAGSGLAVYRKGVLSELWYGLYASRGTNNTAELLGLHHALLSAKDELLQGFTVVIRSDSQYAIKSITEWAPGWERAQWMDGSAPRKNADLIKPMFELYRELKGQLVIQHVRGHHGIQGNELADRMAALAIESEELELRRYTDPLDIDEILAFTVG